MKSSSIFWGLFFITLGILFFVYQINIFSLNFDWILQYWPILLILWGISVLAIPKILKQFLAAVSAIFIAVFIIALFNCGFDTCRMNNNYFNFDIDNSSINKDIGSSYIQYDSSYLYTTLYIDLAAVNFNMQDTTDYLIGVDDNVNKGTIELDTDNDGNNLKVYLNLDNNIRIKNGKFKNNYKVKLNSNPIWDIKFDAGASKIDCDFSQYKVRYIDIDAGAASMKFIIGKLLDTTNIDIDAGASTIRIHIPYNSGCKINSQVALSGSDFNGFTSENGEYYSPDYSMYKNKIFIDLNGAISNFQVIRDR